VPPVSFDLGHYPGAASRAAPRVRGLAGRDAVGTSAAVAIDVSKDDLDACPQTVPDGDVTVTRSRPRRRAISATSTAAQATAANCMARSRRLGTLLPAPLRSRSPHRPGCRPHQGARGSGLTSIEGTVGRAAATRHYRRRCRGCKEKARRLAAHCATLPLPPMPTCRLPPPGTATYTAATRNPRASSLFADQRVDPIDPVRALF
jgi:hypothetical protein